MMGQLVESLVRQTNWPEVPEPELSVSTQPLGTTPFHSSLYRC